MEWEPAPDAPALAGGAIARPALRAEAGAGGRPATRLPETAVPAPGDSSISWLGVMPKPISPPGHPWAETRTTMKSPSAVMPASMAAEALLSLAGRS